jgi:uroporphyrinogen decarboxylase
MIPQKRRTIELLTKAYSEKRRIVAPLVGFPGCDITGFSIKVAQQNHGNHFACVKALVDLLKPDIAFMMMDLSVEANALGLPVRFPVDESSSVERHPVETVEDLQQYRQVNILQDSRIQSYVKTIEMMAMGLPGDVLKCAYVIGPLTLAGLLRSAEQVAMDSILNPDMLHTLCKFTTNIIQDYAGALINAGADLICILEPTGVILGPQQFRDFSSFYVKHIIESYKYAKVETIYHVCGNTMHLVNEMAQSGVTALSIDSVEFGVDIERVAATLPENVAVIGNISPTVTLKDGTPADVRKAVTELMRKMKPYKNFILSTGCDIPPQTPIENLKAFMEAARGFK